MLDATDDPTAAIGTMVRESPGKHIIRHVPVSRADLPTRRMRNPGSRILLVFAVLPLIHGCGSNDSARMGPAANDRVEDVDNADERTEDSKKPAEIIAAAIEAHGGEPISPPAINAVQGVYPNDNLGVLLALNRAEFQLSVVPTYFMDDRPVDRIRLEAGGQWVGDLYFDGETHLLIASKKELFDDTMGRSRAIEAHYSNCKSLDGLKLPMSIRTAVDGEFMATITVTDVKFMDAIDESVFARPVVRK